jgi:hypothetical protein
MTTTTPRRGRSRKPRPDAVHGHFVGGASKADVCHGSAVLAIVLGDDTDRDEQVYWTQAIYDGDTCTGFQLVKFGTGDTYTVPRSLDACTCPDHQYHPRPGGCKHQQALKQALPTVRR